MNDSGKRKGGAGCGFSVAAGFVVFVLFCVMGTTRACIACDSGVTDPALAALNQCPAAREALGDDIGWSVVGCSNYRSRSGGDPINQGCHSSGSYQTPVSGTKARGSYSFSFSATAGQNGRFNGGSLWVPGGRTIMISADLSCK